MVPPPLMQVLALHIHTVLIFNTIWAIQQVLPRPKSRQTNKHKHKARGTFYSLGKSRGIRNINPPNVITFPQCYPRNPALPYVCSVYCLYCYIYIYK